MKRENKELAYTASIGVTLVTAAIYGMVLGANHFIKSHPEIYRQRPVLERRINENPIAMVSVKNREQKRTTYRLKRRKVPNQENRKRTPFTNDDLVCKVITNYDPSCGK